MKIVKKQKFKTSPHLFNGKLHCLPWYYCSGCGLILLNNDATRRRANQPCFSMEN